MRSKFYCLPLLLLAACATFTYQEPISGPRARVRFVGSSSNSSATAVYNYKDPKNCNDESRLMILKNGFLLRSTPRKLGLPLWQHYHENQAKEVYVTAGIPIYYIF